MTFQFASVDPSSTVADVLISQALDGRNACYIAYVISSAAFYLVGDDGSTLILAAPTASNSQCMVTLAGQSVAGSTLTLNISYTFTSAFATNNPPYYTGNGDKLIFGGASDSGGWTILGTWRVWKPSNPPSTPRVESTTTSNSRALHQLLTAKVSAAVANPAAQVLVNNNLDARNACYLTYTTDGYLYLVANDGSTLLSPSIYLNNSSGTSGASNSQCTLNSASQAVNQTPSGNWVMTISADVTFTSSFQSVVSPYLSTTKTVYSAVQANGGNSTWQPFATVFGPLGPGLSGPTELHTNLGPLQVDLYTDSTPVPNPSSLINQCSGAASVRSCYRDYILPFLRQQGVTGIRVILGFCGGGNSTPLVGCGGSSPTTVTFDTTWPGKLQNFFTDMYNNQIYAVHPTMAHGDFAGVSTPDGSVGVHYMAPGSAPGGTACNAHPILEYTATEPWGRNPCTDSPPYNCPNTNPPTDCSTYCQDNAAYPVGDNVTGYLCSPANPNFVGWQNIDNVVNHIITAAAAAHVSIYEFEIESEINAHDFPVQARLIFDNAASAATGNPDSLSEIRSYMTANGFDSGKVTLSAPEDRTDVAGMVGDCFGGYGDHARLVKLDEIASIIGAGQIGTTRANASTGLWCGGSTPNYTMPYENTQPNVVDLHTYPCLLQNVGGSPGSCYTGNPGSAQDQAQLIFSDLAYFVNNFPGISFSTAISIGETFVNGTCDSDPVTNAPAEVVAGFRASSLIGQSMALSPFLNVSSNSCFMVMPSNNENINAPNNQGPYTPTLQSGR